MSGDASAIFMGGGVGLCCLFYGFYVLHKAQHYNIPRHKIRGLPMGHVRISGKVKHQKALKSPLEKVNCAYYLVKVVIEEKLAEFTTWNAAEKSTPFFVEDSTGKVLVDPDSADIDAPYQKAFKAKKYDDLPPEAKKFVTRDHFGFLKAKSVTVKEYVLKEGDKVYINGAAGDNPHVKNTTGKKNVDDIMVTRGENEFIISLRPITIGNLLKIQAITMIIGGALCILAGIALNLWEIGLI